MVDFSQARIEGVIAGLRPMDGSNEMDAGVSLIGDMSDRIEKLESVLRAADEFLTVLQTPGSEPLNSINGGDKAARSYWTAELRNQARAVWASVGNTINCLSHQEPTDG